MTVGLLSFGRAAQADLFVFAGQSNTQVNSSTLVSLPAYIVADSGVQIWDIISGVFVQYAAGQTSALQPGLAQQGGGVVGNWGAEAQFSYLYRQANPTKTLFIVKFGIGSTQLNQFGATDWHPASTNEYFQTVQDAITGAKAAITALGMIPTVRAALWMQGEQDASGPDAVNAAPAYATNVAALITAVRSRWGDASTKFIAGKIATGWGTDVPNQQVRDALKGIAALDSAKNWCLPNFCPSAGHFDATGAVQFGIDQWYAYTSAITPMFEHSTNGDFSSGTTGWVGQSNSSAFPTDASVMSVSAGAMTVAAAVGHVTPGAVQRLDNLVVGACYEFEYEIVSATNGNWAVRIATDTKAMGNDFGLSGVFSYNNVNPSVGVNKTQFVAGATTLYMGFHCYNFATNATLVFKGVKVFGF